MKIILVAAALSGVFAFGIFMRGMAYQDLSWQEARHNAFHAALFVWALTVTVAAFFCEGVHIHG